MPPSARISRAINPPPARISSLPSVGGVCIFSGITHLSPNEKIPQYLVTFTWKKNENTTQEINDKNRSERVWNFWHPFRCRYNFETEVLKIEVYRSCRFKSNRYFSQKVNTIKDKSDFLALHSYFWTKVLVRISMLNISVLSSLWKHLHRSFGSFRFHRLDCFYCLQCFYHSFCFYHTFVTFLSFVWFLFWVSFRTRVLSYLWCRMEHACHRRVRTQLLSGAQLRPKFEQNLL